MHRVFSETIFRFFVSQSVASHSVRRDLREDHFFAIASYFHERKAIFEASAPTTKMSDDSVVEDVDDFRFEGHSFPFSVSCFSNDT